MDITLSNHPRHPQPLSSIPENSKPVKLVVLHGVERSKDYGWHVWETNDGHQKCYFCLGGSKTKRPRIYKWIEEEGRWTCRNSNKYRSLEGLDEQGLWEKYGRE